MPHSVRCGFRIKTKLKLKRNQFDYALWLKINALYILLSWSVLKLFEENSWLAAFQENQFLRSECKILKNNLIDSLLEEQDRKKEFRIEMGGIVPDLKV